MSTRTADAPPKRLVFCEYAEAVLVAVLVALFIKAFVFELFLIPSASMEDNLLVGDHIVVNKFIYAPHVPACEALLPYRALKRGDVFVFKYPPEPSIDYIKRAIGLPGDHIEIKGQILMRNGEPLREPYRRHSPEPRSPAEDPAFETIVSPDGLFALGDNRENSRDSREWGDVPRSYVEGRAVLVYWSFAPKLSGGSSRGPALDFFRRLRWRRTFQLVS